MGGASVAAPLDGLGALYWNPASMTALQRAIDVGLDTPLNPSRATATMPADALGPGVPPNDLVGSLRTDRGNVPQLSSALVYSREDSIWTLGFGAYNVGGLFTTQASPLNASSNSPSSSNGFGMGTSYSRVEFFQLAPAVAIQIGNHLSLGISPTFTSADWQIAPRIFPVPDLGDGAGFIALPGDSSSGLRWGVGAQAGVFLTTEIGWNFGLSVKSPQWFSPFQVQDWDDLGNPQSRAVNIDLPLVASAGVAFRGIPGWLVAADVRWTDYENTDGFRHSAIGPDGLPLGTGWRSVLSLSSGVQYRWREFLSLRAGYAYSQNPLPNPETTFDIVSPAFYQHVASAGAAADMSRAIVLSLAYYHSFRGRNEGPLHTSAGPIAGSRVEQDTNASSVVAGITVRY